MIINCFYDDEYEKPDIVYLPKECENIEEVQNDFFEWMFDKNNHHKYWAENNGILVCNYGTDAFIEWINSTMLKDCEKKAVLLCECAEEWNNENCSLVF